MKIELSLLRRQKRLSEEQTFKLAFKKRPELRNSKNKEENYFTQTRHM